MRDVESWRQHGELREFCPGVAIEMTNIGTVFTLSFEEQDTPDLLVTGLRHKQDSLKSIYISILKLSPSLQFRVQVMAWHKNKQLHGPERHH